jgi:serine phosphatase RsbU (regulator of sigma subunit)
MDIMANIDLLGTDNEGNSVGLDALMGYCYQALGKPRQAKENYERAYRRVRQWLERDSSAMALLWGVETYNTISEKYLENHEYDEAMRWADRTDSLMPALTEFYGSRFPEGVDTYRGALALIRARAALGQGRQELAERAFADYNRTDCSKTIGGRICATNYLMEAHRYAEAADCYAETDQFMATYYSDVTLEHIQETYMPKLRANLYAGRKDSALYVARQITEFYDSALTRYKRSEAAELATVYDTQGKERKIVEQQADLLRQRLWGIAGALVLIVFFFLAYDLHRRRARRRLAAAHADLETAHADLQTAYDKLEETTAAKERIESELRIARGIQMSMVPSSFPDCDGLDLYAEMTPAKEVGGDLYGYVLDGARLYFCVGDVSGKGVPASLFMAQTARLFQTFAKEGIMPADMATRMNRELAENNERSMFVTMFIGLADLDTGSLDYCNCGHNPPVVDGTFLQMAYQNLPLGLWEDYTFQGEHMEDVRGRRLLIYTDGLNEAMNPANEQFGDERLMQLMQQAASLNAHQVIDMLSKAVAQFRDGAEPNDDLTLMALCVKPFNKS